VKFFLPVLVALTLSLGGCGFLASAEHGASAALTTPDGQPIPSAPKGDNSLAYTLGVALMGAGLFVADRLTGGLASKSTINGLVNLTQQLGASLFASVPATVHAQSLQGLAQSVPVTTPAPVAPAQAPATS
jgi:hypothetical protein